MKLCDLANKLNCILTGDGEIDIKGIAGIKEARKGELTFVANSKYNQEIKNTQASAIIISQDAPEINIPTLRSDNPYLTFAKALEFFYVPPSLSLGVHPTAIISGNAIIGKNPCIQAHVVIGENVLIGNNVIIYPNVTIYDNVVIGHQVIIHSNSVIREHTQIGNNVIIQNGVIIGGDGFSFAKKQDGSHYKMVQLGKVIIEDQVEIQSNSAIDRATVGDTIIRRGAKIDNLVQIGHGCSIGENTIVCGLVGLAGSTHVGNNVILAGQVGTAGHQTIADNVIVTAKSGVAGSIEKNKIISGIPAIDAFLWKKAVICFTKLPDLFKNIKKLEKSVDSLHKIINGQHAENGD